MRSTGESFEEYDRKRGNGSIDSKSDLVDEDPKWVLVEAGEFGTVEDMFAPVIDRLCRAIEKDIKDVSKN